MSSLKIKTDPIRLDFLGSKRSEDLPWERRSKHVLYKFTLGTDIQKQIFEWSQSVAGKWCVEKATDLECHFNLSYDTMNYTVVVVGNLSPKHSTFHTLKFG